MKVCKTHIKTSGMKKRDLEIVSPDQCELCNLNGYFNTDNPARKTEHEVVEMMRTKRLNRGLGP